MVKKTKDRNIDSDVVKVFASFPGYKNITIEVDVDGVEYAVESFYTMGAVFAAPVK